MTAIAPSRRAAVAATIPDDAYVLPERITMGFGTRGPRFGDPVWDFRPFVPRTNRVTTRCDFTQFTDPDMALAAREHLYSRVRRGGLHNTQRHTPTKITYVGEVLRDFKDMVDRLERLGVQRLADVTDKHLDVLLKAWRAEEPRYTTYGLVLTMRHIAAHSPFMTGDRLTVTPWPGRTAKSLVGIGSHKENTTRRIPEYISGPLLEGAVFYVEHVAGDLLRARAEIQALERARDELRATGALQPNGARDRLEAFLDTLREEGRPLPATPLQDKDRFPKIPSIDGVLQDVNRALVELFCGIRLNSACYHLPMLRAAGQELGYEEGGLRTALSLWPKTEMPWRRGLSPYLLRRETNYLRTACWIIVAFLSGMRDVEVRELGRDCAFTEPTDDGRTRYKIRGKVFKGRKLSGEEAEWVVLPIVHQAIDVLLQINDDPTHLFGYRQKSGYVLLSAIPLALGRFRDHLNDLFSTDDGLFVPAEAVTGESAPGAEDGPDEGGRPQDEDGEGERIPWAFNTRQFRRTLAWHIAHQPFGIVAGARQYQHAKHTVFEGYAGTSASGFPAEVASEQAVAKLDYLEDLYRDHAEGSVAAGGAAKTINAEFDRIRRELGELPGDVPRGPRLRAMLKHLTKTLHPGVLNDCFYNSATAVCEKRAKPLGRPLPMLNMCSICPNARRTSVHLPRLIIAREQAKAALDEALPDIPLLQKIALTDYVTSFDDLLADLQPEGTPA